MTQSSPEYKRQVAKSITSAFYCVSVVASIIVFLAIVLGLVVPLCFVGTEKILAAKLVSASTGMLIGEMEIVLGLLLSLIGITADYDVEGSVGTAKIKLASASPGLLLIVCGNILIGFSLARDFEFKEMETQGPSTVQQTVVGSDVKPMHSGGPK